MKNKLSIRQVVAATSHAVRTGPVEHRRAADVGQTAKRPSPKPSAANPPKR